MHRILPLLQIMVARRRYELLFIHRTQDGKSLITRKIGVEVVPLF